MRLPKRVPWSNISELEQVFSWIYAAEEDSATKVFAVNRLAAWKASTALPHALESTLSLLTTLLQDEDSSNSPVPHTSTLALRQSYSLSLIRLVNGLVDPLQQGAYARPIATIAAQIGLPLWLVELRHASTHEELPSLELLREGAREAMSWLLRNYFLPTISPMNQSAAAAAVSLAPITPLLKKYKQLLKMAIRDASLKTRLKSELLRIFRDIEQWISEARVAAAMAKLEAQNQEDEDDEKERWALEHLCDALVGRGGLVPVSKRKRPSPLQGLKVPIPQHIDLWSPLLLHIHSRHATFPSILLSRILAQIFSSSNPKLDPSTFKPAKSDAPANDPSHDNTLASWGLWIIDRWGDEPGVECEPLEVVKDLLLGLGRNDNRAARALLTALGEKDPKLRERVNILSTSMLHSDRISAWSDDTLQLMSERLSTLRSGFGVAGRPTPLQHSTEDVEMTATGDVPSGSLAPGPKKVTGWRLLEESQGWKPCPIGVYHSPSS